MLRRIFSTGLILLGLVLPAIAAEKISLTLEEAIRMANDSALIAFRYKNLYEAGYWEWRTFKANRLPGLSLDITPASYNRYITQRYNYDENIDVFRSQKTYLASAGLSATQNVDFLGGSLYVESDLE